MKSMADPEISVSAYLMPRILFDDTIFFHAGEVLDHKCNTMPLRVTDCSILLLELRLTLKSGLDCEADTSWTLSHFETPKKVHLHHIILQKQTFRMQSSYEIIIII